MTYPRSDYWPASSGYFDAPEGRGLGQSLWTVPIPPELWGDLPGTPSYPLPPQLDPFDDAGASRLRIPGFEFGGYELPPTPVEVPGGLIYDATAIPVPEVPGFVPPPPGGGMQHLPFPGQPPASSRVPPPTTIPDEPKDEPKKPIPMAWILGGAFAAAVALGAVVYLATKKTTPRRRNPRRRPVRRRARRARRSNPYASDAAGVVHYFPEESSREQWLARAPSRKSRRVKGSKRKVRKAKAAGRVVRHRKAKPKRRTKSKSKKRRANPLSAAQVRAAGDRLRDAFKRTGDPLYWAQKFEEGVGEALRGISQADTSLGHLGIQNVPSQEYRYQPSVDVFRIQGDSVYRKATKKNPLRARQVQSAGRQVARVHRGPNRELAHTFAADVRAAAHELRRATQMLGNMGIETSQGPGYDFDRDVDPFRIFDAAAERDATITTASRSNPRPVSRRAAAGRWFEVWRGSRRFAVQPGNIAFLIDAAGRPQAIASTPIDTKRRFHKSEELLRLPEGGSGPTSAGWGRFVPAQR